MADLQERITQHRQLHGETIGVIGIDPRAPPTLWIYVPQAVLDQYQRTSGDPNLSGLLASARIWRNTIEPQISDKGLSITDDFESQHSVDACLATLDQSGFTPVRSLTPHSTGAVLSISAEYTGAPCGSGNPFPLDEENPSYF